MKKLLATLLFGAALALAALPASAQSTDSTVTMTANAQGAAVSLALPKETAQGVRALRLSFEVESGEPIDAVFDFDSALPGTVQQYRYDAESGRMNVYVAGGTDLFPAGSATLGSIRLDAPEGSTARVTLVEDSLELVNAAFGKTPAPAVDATAVEVTLGSDAQTPAPEQPGSGTGSDQTTNQQTSQSTPTPAPQVTTTPVSTAAPSTGTQQPAAQSGSGSKKPAGSAQTQTAPETTAEPTETPVTEASPAPSAQPQEPVQTATPEQAEGETASTSGLPPVVLILVGCLVAALIIGTAVIRFRNR